MEIIFIMRIAIRIIATIVFGGAIIVGIYALIFEQDYTMGAIGAILIGCGYFFFRRELQ